jgi:hypothetical protein
MKEEVVYCRDGNPLVSIAARVGGVINIVFAVFFACGWVTTNINTIGKDWSGLKTFLAGCVIIVTWAGGLLISAHVIESFWKESSRPTTLYLETKLARWLVVASAFLSLAVFSFGMFFVKLAFIESLILAAATLGASLLSQQVICAICVVPTSSLNPPRDDSGEVLSYASMGVVVSLIWLGKHFGNQTGVFGALFLLSNVTSVAFLWMESDRACVAKREVIPLSLASLGWLLTALGVYLYGNTLQNVSTFLPYFLILLPTVFLAASYYVTKPIKE